MGLCLFHCAVYIMSEPSMDLFVYVVRSHTQKAIALARDNPKSEIGVVCAHKKTYELALGYIEGHFRCQSDVADFVQRIDVVMTSIPVAQDKYDEIVLA